MFGKDQSDWREALKHGPAKALTRVREFIERSTNNARIEAMVGIGRLAAEAKPEALFVISEMRKGDFSERFLALNSCHGSRDGEHILSAITDRSEIIRSVARRLVCIYGTDDQIVAAFEASALVTRKSLLRQLRVRKRFAAVDRILKILQDSDLQDFGAYLPFGSDQFVNAHWPQIESDSSCLEWERLARNKRDFAAERILALLTETEQYEPRTVWIANSVLALLAKQRAAKTMEIVDALLRICSLNQIRLHEAVRSFPVDVARLCAAHEDRASVNFFYAYDKLDDELLVSTMKKYPPNYGIARILRKLPVVSRRLLYDNLVSAWRADGIGILDDAIIEEMPVDIRELEAGTHLSMDSLFTNPQLRMKYVPFLPFEEVKSFVASPIADPDAELRGVAWNALISSLRYNRGETGYVLEEIKKRKREQDPVRQIIAQSLSTLPPSLWKEEHLGDLSTIIKDALDARDLSHATAFYLETLILQLVPFHAHWGAKNLAEIWRERGQPAVYNFEFKITDDQAKKIEPEIVDVLQRWTKKEYEAIVIRAARLFGKRLRVTERILHLLRHIILNSNNQYNSEQAFQTVHQNAFNTLSNLVPEMLKKDPTWATVKNVVAYLLRYRQDLLTPHLGQTAFRGRFDSGARAIVPSLQQGMSRLSSNQLKIYAKSLNAMGSDKEIRGWENHFVISHLSAVPNCPIEYLSRFLEVKKNKENDHAGYYERDIAIYAISRLDEGQGVPTLISALQDPAQAYAAVYALRSIIMKMPGEQAFEILRDAPMKQITVAKEIVRLLGDIRHEEALQKLFSLTGEELHRDVRVAAITALWRNLDREESWDILARAMDDEDDAVAFTVIRTPADRLTKDGQKRLVELLARGLKHDAIRVRMKTLERLGYFPVSDPDMSLLDSIIEALSSEAQEECRVAARALVVLYGHKALNAFPQAASAIISKRRNLVKFVDHLEAALAESRAKTAPATYATINALEADPLTLTLRARLAIASMPWNELAVWFKELDEKQLLHADVLQEIGNRLNISRRADIEQMSELEKALAECDSVNLRRIALSALVAQSGTSRGWTDEKLERLEVFRNDPSPYIAEVAQFTLPAEEEALKAAQR